MKVAVAVACLFGGLALTQGASAVPVGLDGSLGGKWCDLSVAYPLRSASAPNSNQGALGTLNVTGYRIHFCSDLDYIYDLVGVDVETSVNWANLYFDVGRARDSNFSLEVMLDRGSAPGTPGYYDYLTKVVSTLASTIDWALSWSNFVEWALEYLAGNNNLPAGADRLNGAQLRLVEVFGWGGSNYYNSLARSRLRTATNSAVIPIDPFQTSQIGASRADRQKESMSGDFLRVRPEVLQSVDSRKSTVLSQLDTKARLDKLMQTKVEFDE